MKKNKLYVFIVLLTVMLIFGAAASCPECENRKITSSSDTRAYSTADTAKPDPNLIHGVLPAKVTGHATGNKTKDEGSLEFWNVGRIGGEQYSKATYIITRNGKTIKTYEGYFAGGPNGEMHLTCTDGKDIHGKLEGGIEFVSDDGSVIDIDNPDAFDGWKDDEVEEDAAESTETEETTTEAETTSTESNANLIHGVVPTKVTGTSAGSGKSGYIGILDFWNVGKLGGEQYSKATYIMTLDGKTTSTWEGYFTGGPNGEFFLSGKDGELHGKLVDGKQLVGEGNGIADIDNPEAFDGWID